jgi:hypothetical protein
MNWSGFLFVRVAKGDNTMAHLGERVAGAYSLETQAALAAATQAGMANGDLHRPRGMWETPDATGAIVEQAMVHPAAIIAEAGARLMVAAQVEQ